MPGHIPVPAAEKTMKRPAPKSASLQPVNLITRQSPAPGVYLLAFPSTGNFRPGQVVALALGPADPPRLYSLAGDNRSDTMLVLFDVVEEGMLTPGLARLEPGDRFWCSAPFGNFSPAPASSVLIASGTGIAPFASLFFSGKMGDNLLIHGGRFLHNFYFRDDFLPVMKERYVRCCSREEGPGIYPGRLTAYLRGRDPFPPGKKYYLCGSAEMVVETRDILIESGVPFRDILSEIYF